MNRSKKSGDKAFKRLTVPAVVRAAEELRGVTYVRTPEAEKARDMLISLLLRNPSNLMTLLADVMYSTKEVSPREAQVLMDFMLEMGQLAVQCAQNKDTPSTAKQGKKALNALVGQLAWMAGEWCNDCEDPGTERHQRCRALMFQALWTHMVGIIWPEREELIVWDRKLSLSDPLNPFSQVEHASDEGLDAVGWWARLYAFGSTLLSADEYLPVRSFWTEGLLWYMRNGLNRLNSELQDRVAVQLLEHGIHRDLHEALKNEEVFQIVYDFASLIRNASTLQLWVRMDPDLPRLLVEAQARESPVDTMFDSILTNLHVRNWDELDEAVSLMFTVGDAMSSYMERRIAEENKNYKEDAWPWYSSLLRAACLYEAHTGDDGLVRWAQAVIFDRIEEGKMLWDEEDDVYHLYAERMHRGVDMREFLDIMQQELDEFN